MIKKLLLLVLITFSCQLVIAQAPGDDCASATPLTLIPGGIYSTGGQNVLLNGNDFGFAENCSGAPWGTGNDGVYSFNVTTTGDIKLQITAGCGSKIELICIVIRQFQPEQRNFIFI